MKKIGIFICGCASNISSKIDINSIAGSFKRNKDVLVTEVNDVLCSEQGQKFIAKTIKKNKLTHIVIAACSPKEHERTFRKCLKDSGINPYLLQIANIREQCAWVVPDKEKATGKAAKLINAAVKRVIYHRPLKTKMIECRTDVVVIGAGVSGITAALTAAQKDRKVYLVEKSPVLGGKAVRYTYLFPDLECASCLISPFIDRVLHNGNIEVFTCSEVVGSTGDFGNMEIEIKENPRYVDKDKCIGCGACIEVCPVSAANEYSEDLDKRKAVFLPYPGAVPNIAVIDGNKCLTLNGKECGKCRAACAFGAINFDDKEKITKVKAGAVIISTGGTLYDIKKVKQYGYSKSGNVYTAMEFERMIDEGGPTEGKIRLRSGKKPKKIALIHCAGSRTAEHEEHCSGICCGYLIKFAEIIRRKLSGTEIYHVYSDMCLPGKEAQSFLNGIKDIERTELLRMRSPGAVNVKPGEKIRVEYTSSQGTKKRVQVDMAVLAPAMKGGSDSGVISGLFDAAVDKSGFFEEEQAQMEPVSSANKGVFMSGCARAPQNVQQSVAEGTAAAGKILSILRP
ncbi:MAG: CoB--CoM heterodisulfide reductase iron-sulfur subunit A family protein, partial [Candidatus Omnitrophica bacterium]|nr:CoB--CoM heterodisulfide reductase iron-sulfur subunit A family protein [Candidatus Omnitrophota bacterium]